MKTLTFIILWSCVCAAAAGLLWKKSGSRNKIYWLFFINMAYLVVIFMGYPKLLEYFR